MNYMNLEKRVYNILNNKTLLHIVFIVAILNIIGWLVINDFRSILYFVLFALLIQHFNKNMILVLGVPLIFINLLRLPVKEGLEGQKDKTPLKKEIKKENVTTELPIDLEEHTGETEEAVDESFEVGRVKKGGYKIDYASTIESAYDDLNKILGSEGMKNLTEDTQKLVKQQAQLTESMKSMEPFIKNMAPMLKQAQGMLNSMNTQEGLGSIMEMAKKMTGANKTLSN